MIRPLEELLKLDWPDMTGDELHWLREQRVPLHCQTMECQGFDEHRTVYSDVEALTKEILERKVARLIKLGWYRTSGPFIRNAATSMQIQEANDVC